MINAIYSHHVVSCLSQCVLVCNFGLLKSGFALFLCLCFYFFVFCRTAELKVASCHLMCHTVVVVAVSPGTGQVMVLFFRGNVLMTECKFM